MVRREHVRHDVQRRFGGARRVGTGPVEGPVEQELDLQHSDAVTIHDAAEVGVAATRGPQRGVIVNEHADPGEPGGRGGRHPSIEREPGRLTDRGAGQRVVAGDEIVPPGHDVVPRRIA